MDIYKYQSLSFRNKALWELKKEKRKLAKTSFTFWVEVQLVNNKKYWYQLPKDLQKAMQQHYQSHKNNWQSVILGAAINVPVTNYDKHGNTKLRVGIVRQVVRKKRHISNSRWVTRSQFGRINKWFCYHIFKATRFFSGKIDQEKMPLQDVVFIKFMQHDYSEKQRNIILFDLENLAFRQTIFAKLLERFVIAPINKFGEIFKKGLKQV